MHRIFLLSPASCRGRRAEMLLRDGADFPLARELRSAAGAELGDVFSFLSGLYFRGKLAYARAFARAPAGVPGVEVITTTRGLLYPETRVTVEGLREFAAGDIRSNAPGFVEPLERSARRLRDHLPPDVEVVLLGSIATDKYLEVLLRVFDDRLLFPDAFIGRGDMSRGGLLLRARDAGRELGYVVARHAPRRGVRPPRLGPPAGSGAESGVEPGAESGAESGVGFRLKPRRA
jgi:hypothetical protein